MIESLQKELNDLKETQKTDTSSERLQNERKEFEEKLSNETKKFDDLKAQYELLEEEFVLKTAKLTTEKEKCENDIKAFNLKIRQLEEKESKYKLENEELLKQSFAAQRKLADLERSNTLKAKTDLEKNRLKDKLNEKELEYETLLKQHEMVTDQLSNFKKENDDIRRKLEDFERINKVQRTLNDHNAMLENELKKLKTK